VTSSSLDITAICHKRPAKLTRVYLVSDAEMARKQLMESPFPFSFNRQAGQSLHSLQAEVVLVWVAFLICATSQAENER
jgi:hypothetical protein